MLLANDRLVHTRKLERLLALLLLATAGCGEVIPFPDPIEWSFIDGTLMFDPGTNRTLNPIRGLPATGYSDGLKAYLYRSPLIPHVRGYSGNELPDFHSSAVVWTTPGRAMSLSWEARLEASFEAMGYDKADPLDVGLCVRKVGVNRNELLHAVTRQPVTTRKDLSAFNARAGDVLYVEDRYATFVQETMTKKFEVVLQTCDGSATATPNPFNYPRAYDQACHAVTACAGFDTLCTLDCELPATVNASYRVQGIEHDSAGSGTVGTTSKLVATAQLGPTINVPAFVPNGGTTVTTDPDGENVPANNQLSTIIRPLTWDPNRAAWTFTVERAGGWVENFSKDYTVGAFRVFSVHTIEGDAKQGPMTYPGVALDAWDGVRRLRPQVSIRSEFPGGVGTAVPSACIDRGQGVSAAACPQLSTTTPAQVLGAPEALTWVVTIPSAHPEERKTDDDLMKTSVLCDPRIEPLHPTMRPCWAPSPTAPGVGVLLTNRYYIEFFRPGQGSPTLPEVPPPGEGGPFGSIGT